MTDIEFTDLPEDGRQVFSPTLIAMREEALDTGKTGWVALKGYKNQASAYDAAWRLGRSWLGFEFSSRTDPDEGVTTLYARYIGEEE